MGKYDPSEKDSIQRRKYNTRYMSKANKDDKGEKDIKKRKQASSASPDLPEENKPIANQDETKSKKLKTGEKFENQRDRQKTTQTKRRETGAIGLQEESKSTTNIQSDEKAIVKKLTKQNRGPIKVKKGHSPTFFSGRNDSPVANPYAENKQQTAAAAFSNPEIHKQNLKEEVDESSMENQKLFSIGQIPSEADFVTYRGMPAASESAKKKQDQYKRLDQVIEIVKKHNLTLKPTNNAMLENWQALFKSIAVHNPNAKMLFDEIDPNDPIKKALLATHNVEYIKSIIDKCVHSDQDLDEEVDTDIHINNQTFEVLIKDIATTIEGFNQNNNMIFSIGLPTHHAYREKAAGFCIFNKVAVLIHYFGHTNNVICGLDVNEDDGLHNTLSTSNFPKSRTILHLDSYDPRVYPYSAAGNVKYDKVINEQYVYLPIHLDDPSYAREEARELHPVIVEVLNQIEQACQNNPHDTAIYLVLGWDSHSKEKAGCSRDIYYGINKTTKEFAYRDLKALEANEQRFNDRDFEYFYKQLKEIISKHKIPFVYISLEGGYTQAVNKKQTEILIKTLLTPEIKPQAQLKEDTVNNYSFG
ncbi:hypothetical protein [Legionella gresilensis]|uniref:hypothetical protein n=1 Tax=Legionella gresilensis TaxID=91823 RepID=UPI001041AF7A|nr:hypothetical protein [Legionella gresilensis]